jgi:hypothetical protein
MSRVAQAVILLVIGLTVSGCEGMGDLLALRNGLAETFRTPEVSVSLQTTGALTITLQNSPFDGQAGAEEQATCRQVAEFVRDHFAHYSTVRSVQVGFASRRGVPGISFTRSRVPCSFSHEELGEPQVGPAASDSARPAA